MRITKNKTGVLLFITTTPRPNNSGVKRMADVKVNF